MTPACNLVFVYNADASLSSLLTEVAHKLFAPESFECSLCELTYGVVRQKKSWVNFLHTLPCQYEFYLRNRFIKKFPAYAEDVFPCVYSRQNDERLELLVSAEQINSLTSVEQLQGQILTAVSTRFGL